MLLSAWSSISSAADSGADPAAQVCLVTYPDHTTELEITSAPQIHDPAGDEHYRIVVQYNVLRRSDGTGGFTQLDLIDEHLRHLNWGFRDTPFVFVRIPGVRYIDDDRLFQLDTVSEGNSLYLTYFTPGVANVFFHVGMLYGNPIWRAHTAPTPPNRGQIYGDTRVGLPANVAYSPHELGHFFGLFHPYETGRGGIECVARTNCEQAGDLVCDTPASPTVFGANTLRTGEYFGTATGPCAGDPPYAPLTDVWMEAGWNYGDPGALIRSRFTQGQVDRMVSFLLNTSSDLVGPQRPDILVDCDQDGADDIDEILAGTEPDINEDKVPDQCQEFLQTGDLLVSGMTNIDTNTPRFFDPQNGKFRGSLRTGASFAHQMRTGPDGLIYLTSLSVIQQLDPATGYLVKNLVDGGPQNSGTFTDILFDAAGDLLVLDNTRSDIKRYNRISGAYMGKFANVPLSAPKYMEYGPDNHIYVVGNGAGDNRVVKIDAQTGAQMGDFVSAGTGGLSAGQGLVFHDDGYLYVSDGNAASVLRYVAASGAFDRAFVSGGNNGGLSNPHSLRFGPDGDLYVASRGTHSVKRYDGFSGAYLDDFIAAGSGGPDGTGTIDQPAGLLFASVDNTPVGQAINAGINGAWANLETLGQGVLFDVIESSSQLFMGWFTYETDTGIEPDSEDDIHRWLVALGPYDGDKATLELLAVNGGTFNGPEPVTQVPVGGATIRFTSCREAELNYQFDNGPSGSFKLTRLLSDTLCEELSAKGAQQHD